MDVSREFDEFLCMVKAAPATARRVARLSYCCSRHHHYPIPSTRGEAGGVCQQLAGHNRSGSTSTPAIHVACSADISLMPVKGRESTSATQYQSSQVEVLP